MAKVPSLVINLDCRPGRLANFMAQRAAQRIDVERFRAVYWKDIKLPASWQQLNCGPGGGYACMISHHNAILHAKDRGFPFVLVFEDDAIVPEWFPEELRRFLRHLPSDWDLAFFGGNHDRSPWPECIPRHVSGPVYRGWRNSESMECYVLTAKAFDIALAILDRAIHRPKRWPTLSAFREIQAVTNFYVPLNLPIGHPVGWCHSDTLNRRVNLDSRKSRALVEGWFSDREGVEYLTECMKVPGESVVELGTWMGRSASWVAEWIHSQGGNLHCVDLWNRWSRPKGRTAWQDFEWYMWRTGLLDKIKVIREDVAEAAKRFSDESIAS